MNHITLDAEQYMESELADHNFALLGFTSRTSIMLSLNERLFPSSIYIKNLTFDNREIFSVFA